MPLFLKRAFQRGGCFLLPATQKSPRLRGVTGNSGQAGSDYVGEDEERDPGVVQKVLNQRSLLPISCPKNCPHITFVGILDQILSPSLRVKQETKFDWDSGGRSSHLKPVPTLR